MTDYDKWNSFDADHELRELNDGDESDDISQDLDALICTIHKKKFRSGDTCPLCRKNAKEKNNDPSPKKQGSKHTAASNVRPPAVEAPVIDLSEAEKLKEDGNKQVAALEWDEAIKLYTTALGLLPALPNPRQLAAINGLKLALNLNLGHVALKQEKWTGAVGCCSAALELEPNNRKALFRRGMALANKNANIATAQGSELKTACKDLDAALRVGPPNKEISQALAAARERLELQERHEREGLGIERLKKDIEEMPDDQVSIPALMKQMEAMSRQLPGSTLSKAMEDIRLGKPR